MTRKRVLVKGADRRRPKEALMTTELAATRRQLRATKAQLAEQLADLRSLHALSMRLSSHIELPGLLNEVLSAVCTLQKAPMGLLLLHETGADELQVAAHVGMGRAQADRLGAVALAGPCGLSVAGRRTAVVEDIRGDSRFPAERAVAEEYGYRAVCCVPLHARTGQIIGVIATYFSQPQLPTRRELQLVELYGGQATEFIENSRHFQALHDASRLKDEFLATLSHEIRTPLNAVLGWTRLLRTTNPPTDPNGRRALEAIERNSRIQAQLVEDLLDISRIVTGKLRLSLVPVNLNSVVDAALDTVRPAADNKGLHIASWLADDVTVFGDPDRLQQIVWNLLSNAVRFTPSGGTVTIRLERSETAALISVADTGVGISAAFLPHVFDRFRQDDVGDVHAQKGLGLGLAIVRHLVDAHGGSVSASSAGPDLGSTFVVRLPLGAVDAPRPAEASPAAGGIPSLSGVHVLVVEDEADSRELLATALTTYGAEVTAVASGVEALAALQAHPFDALVADIGMADMNGYALIRAVRVLASTRGRRLPAVALTVYANAREREESITAGFDRHLSKPIEPERVAGIIASLVAESRAEP
jgi:signal transduction histidine kinase/ActR/RegA family two-component response regulator